MNMNVCFIGTENSLTVLVNNKPYSVDSTSPNWDTILRKLNDEDYDEVRDVYCMVDAPVSLLHEFDQEKFYKWILTKDAELRKRKLADAKEKFKTLLDEFPELKNWN